MLKKIKEFIEYFDKKTQTKHKKDLYKRLKHLMNKPIEGLVSKDIITVDENETLRIVASIMSREHKGALAVLKNKLPIGLIKESDFLKLEFKADELDKKVSELIEPKLIYLEPKDSILKAHQVMLENKIRKLIVMQGETFLGIVTQTDLLKEFNLFAEHTMIDVNGLGVVRYLMTKDVVSIEKGSNALAAKNLMRAKKVDSVMVVENRKAVGIVTTKDFVDQIKLNIERLNKATVETIMSSSLASLPPDISVFEANRMMLRPEYNFRRWPVIIGGELLGILSQTDISRGIVEFISKVAESIEKDEVKEIKVTKE